MIEFIQRLRQRYQRIQKAAPTGSNLYASCSQSLKTLALAEVSLLKQVLIESSSDFPLNVVIFGPTQAGKSTLVNCLLQEPLAGVSPLAGYTVHPQGFASGLQPSSRGWLEILFPGFKRLDQKKLEHSDLAGYTLTEFLSPGVLEYGDAVVIWDTPDFDSIDAHGYIDAVLRTIGLADILVLTVSKEKYADQTVWDMLELLAPLEQPLLACINKVVEGEEQTLLRSFQNRFKTKLPKAKLPALVSMPFVEADEKLNSDHIVQAVNTMISVLGTHKVIDQPQNFIKANWKNWIKPVQDEIQDDLVWQEYLQTTIDSAMQNFRKEFLDHPDYYDTFQRAMAELLELLEIPGWGEKLGKVRQVITWPMRKLIGIGKSVLHSGSEKSGISRDKSYEEALLRQLVDQVITEVANDYSLDSIQEESHLSLARQDFRRLLNKSRQKILEQFEQRVSTYQVEFETEIQDAAKELYQRLQDQPALLNSLRATRVTTDAAAVVFALHTGGISLNDFILAPAMLSLSSMLAESSVGQYMNSVKAKLKARQYETVQSLLFDHLQTQLNQLREHAIGSNRFQITEQTIKEIESEFFSA